MASFPRAALFFLVLLVAPLFLCSSATTLDEEERQKEEQALEEVHETEAESRADGVPDPPRDLIVDAQSDTMVMLVWQDPDDTTDVDHYFAYVEEEAMEEEIADVNYCFFYNLEACTEYTFGVMSVSAEGNMSDPILAEGQTEAGDPPAPQNLQVDDYTSTTVTLSWEKPDTQCDIEEYRVKWSKDGVNRPSTITNETSFTVTGLSINTVYTFTVSGFTSYGEGDEAIVQQTTAVFDGGPPEDLLAIGVSTSAINVSWSPPAYEPRYYKVTAPPCVYLNEVVFGLSYLITGRNPCENCNIFVTSYYNDTYQYEADTFGSSQGGEPPPPKSCSVDVKEGAITVEWERPDSNCQLGINSVHWTATKLWGDEEEVSNSTNAQGERFNMLNPVPYSQYAFDISASIEGVFGSPVSCIGTSLETLPGPPVIEADDSVQGKAMVTWETPVEENGYILNYGIFVDGETDPQETVSGEVHSASLTLEPCKTFGLSVKAENSAGWGTPSEVKNVTVADDVLPKKVDCRAVDFSVEVCWDPYDKTCPVSQYNLMWEGDVLWSEELVDANSTSLEWSTDRTCQNIPALPYTTYYVEVTVGNGTDNRNCFATTPMAAPGPPADVNVTTQDLTILVAWTEPEEKNGVIDFYQIEWKPSSGDADSHSTEDNNTFSFDIPGLECGVTVDVTVRAKVETVDELGERSSPQTAYLVNSVDSLNCDSSVSGQVSLSWTLVDKECPITSYNVTWIYDSLWSNDKGKGSQDVGKDETSSTVSSLPAYSNVLIQVHVDSNPVYTECSVITLQEKPSPPTTLQQIANDSSSVTITWDLPQYIRGELEGWYLRWTTLYNESIDEDTVTEVQNRTYMIRNLSKSSTYVVYVSAVNGAGIGQAGKVNASTAYVPTETSQNLGLIIGLSSAGGILLIILLIGGFILFRKKGSPKPPRSAPHMPEVADADSDELYKMQHLSSASQRFQNKLGSVDYGTNSELYTSPRPSLPKDEPGDDDADNQSYPQLNSDNDKGQMFGAPPDRRFSQQVATSLPRLGAYNRRPSQQVNSRMRNFEEYNRRPSQQDLTGRSSLSGGPNKPSLGEYGRRPSQQIDIGRPNLKEYGRRPSQQVDLGKPSLAQYGRRPSQQGDLGRPNLAQYGRRPSQQVDLGKPRLGEYGRRPSQQIELGKPRLSEYGRRPSQQIDIGRPTSSEYPRRPSQQLPSGGGSYPSRLPQGEAPRRSSVDLHSRRLTQQSDTGKPGDRMFMKRPSQQFIPSFEGIQEL